MQSVCVPYTILHSLERCCTIKIKLCGKIVVFVESNFMARFSYQMRIRYSYSVWCRILVSHWHTGWKGHNVRERRKEWKNERTNERLPSMHNYNKLLCLQNIVYFENRFKSEQRTITWNTYKHICTYSSKRLGMCVCI